jgi:hypothetical protein
MKRSVQLLLVLVLILMVQHVDAQCVMCKAVVEESAGTGGMGRGINTAILYLMAIPYSILTVLYFAFFRKKRNFNA